MTKLSERDLQNVTGGIDRMTQNNGSGTAGSYKPVEGSTDSDAK